MKKIYIALSVILLVVPSISFASIDTNLKYGSRGIEVIELQDFLISKSFLLGQVSGNFFSMTRKAVVAYQASVGLPATGFVGSMTRTKINEELSTSNAPAVSAEVAETVATIASTNTLHSGSATHEDTTHLVPGCSSSAGFSVTTGKSCSGVISTASTTVNKIITFPNGYVVEVDALGNIVRTITLAPVLSVQPITPPLSVPVESNPTLLISLGQTTATTSSVYLSWDTNIPTNSKVFLTQTPIDLYTSSTRIISSASGYSTQHFVNVPNLVPGTQYSYTIEAVSSTLSKKVTGVISTNALPVPVPVVNNIFAGYQPGGAQSIANTSGQYLGRFSLSVGVQPVVIKSIRFSVSASSQGISLTDVSLSGDGVFATVGPVDENTAIRTITFTNPVTLPVGTHSLSLKGKISGQGGDTITLTTNPSVDWVVQGKDLVTNVVLPSTTVSLPISVVSGPSFAVLLAEAPALSVPAGTQSITMDAIQINAGTADGVMLSGISLASSAFSGLVNCQLFDGATVLNTGSNVVNPTSNASAFLFDNGLTVSKGATKTLRLKCDASLTAAGTFVWSIPETSRFYITGINSGSSLVPTITSSVGPSITVLQ